MSELEDFEKKVTDAADYVVGKIDGAIDSVGDMLTGESGKRIVGGAAIGAVAAVALPVSLVGGALIGAGYAALRGISKATKGDAPSSEINRQDD